jgi:hypothetical protein
MIQLRDNRSQSIQWFFIQEMGAELEASDLAWAAQGKWIRVWPVVTLPKPESRSFSSAEVSSHRQIQQVQWHSVTTVTPIGYLACANGRQAFGPLSGAAKYPAEVRPSKCIIIMKGTNPMSSRGCAPRVVPKVTQSSRV